MDSDWGKDFFPAPPFQIGRDFPLFDQVEEVLRTHPRYRETWDRVLALYVDRMAELKARGLTFLWRPRDAEGRGWVYLCAPIPEGEEYGEQCSVQTPLSFDLWYNGFVAGREAVEEGIDDNHLAHYHYDLAPTLSRHLDIRETITREWSMELWREGERWGRMLSEESIEIDPSLVDDGDEEPENVCDLSPTVAIVEGPNLDSSALSPTLGAGHDSKKVVGN